MACSPNIRSFLMFSIAAALSTSALARIGPEIAYSTATEIYLVNPNGSGKVRLYRSKSNNFISSVALQPGGGTIAFVENWTLKFLDYNAAGQPVGTVRTVKPSCYRLADVHYHPNTNSVIYRDLCGGPSAVKMIAVPATATDNPTPATLFTEPNMQDLGPMEPDGRSFVYTMLAGSQMELRRHYVDGTADPANPLLTSANTQIRYPDVSNGATRILYSDSPLAAGAYPGPGYTSEIDAASGASLRSNFITGRSARYAPDDVRVVFIVYNSYNERYLRYLDTDGLTKQIGGRSVYWSVDWGN